MKFHSAFTMIELIFVIVIMGIIGKFGTEFLAQSYNSFIFSNVNNTLQSNSAMAVEFIASRLQHRIKDSVIVREGKVTTFDALSSSDSGKNYTVLEWVQTDIDGYRGLNKPYWSGIIDLDLSDKNKLVSPLTDTTEIDELIQILSYGNSKIENSALYFIGSNNDIDGYGWDGVAITEQNSSVMHPIKANSNVDEFISSNGDDFSMLDVYEYYKLSWTANAIVLEDDTLYLYYDYQPWNGEKFYDSNKEIQKTTLMENVSTFRAVAIGSIIKIQICVKSDLVEEYSLCKEKTVF